MSSVRVIREAQLTAPEASALPFSNRPPDAGWGVAAQRLASGTLALPGFSDFSNSY